jgi:hypothetical protein
MHREYATACAPVDPALEDALPDPADELLEEVLEVALDPSCATVGLLAPPPQPAASSASAASPAIGPVAFISSSPRAGWMLLARVFYETAGYTTVTGAVTAL